MFFTGKGDNGTTKTFGCNQRISKSSAVAEALGTLDELNAVLGLVKTAAGKSDISIPKSNEGIGQLINHLQHDLFIVQAELAGADKTIGEEKVKTLEKKINAIERSLPEIKTFFVPGGTELATRCDLARTVARRAERRVISVKDEGKQEIGQHTMAYVNRLSSILYALTRLVNHENKVEEQPPTYE